MESHYREGKAVGLDCFIYTCERLHSDINIGQSQLFGVHIICWHQIGCILIHGKCRISQVSD